MRKEEEKEKEKREREKEKREKEKERETCSMCHISHCFTQSIIQLHNASFDMTEQCVQDRGSESAAERTCVYSA